MECRRARAGERDRCLFLYFAHVYSLVRRMLSLSVLRFLRGALKSGYSWKIYWAVLRVAYHRTDAEQASLEVPVVFFW